MLGEYLRKHREEASLSLKDISQQTRIRVDYLRALEDEDFDKIPGKVFVKGYIKEYLRILSISPDEALRLYEEDIRSKEPEEEHVPVVEKKRRLPYQILYPVIVLIIAIPLIIFYTKKDNSTDQIIQSAKKEAVSVKKEEDSGLLLSPLSTAEADYTNKHILKISTMEETWVFINIDNDLKYSMILKPGEIRSWTGKEKFYLRIGNAGGIKISFDGKDLGSPGRKGEVVSLTLPEEIGKFKDHLPE